MKFVFGKRLIKYLQKISKQAFGKKEILPDLVTIAQSLLLDEFEIVAFALWIDFYSFTSEDVKQELWLIAITLKFHLYAEPSLENF